MNIYSDLSATVGKTPLMELARVGRALPGRIVGKLEMRYPCGRRSQTIVVLLADTGERYISSALFPGR